MKKSVRCVAKAARHDSNLFPNAVFLLLFILSLLAFRPAHAELVPLPDGELRSTHAERSMTGLVPLDDAALSTISAQGFDAKQPQFDEANQQDPGLAVLGQVLQTSLPILNFIEADTRISGVQYKDGVSPVEILINEGAVRFNLPDYVESIAMDNIRVLGSAGGSFGSLLIQGLSLSGSSITIRTNP
ncbi:hypothetical protein [Kistimonas asteriae]|uniref:hypothetical protein n=1 Tax=Kistimonas asteriae TaxID=517724 RepID=UPI001BAE02C7|nr:hypothetical protein [Kistimonas asteriae]